MHIGRLYLISSACLSVLMTLCCCSTKNNFKSLVKNVESYHHDLIFERYEVAAKNITPTQREAWLDAIQSQKLHFAEIEIKSTSPCEADRSDEDGGEPEDGDCAVIESDMQWFVEGSPSVRSGRVRTTWQYDEDEGAWFIVAQEQR